MTAEVNTKCEEAISVNASAYSLNVATVHSLGGHMKLEAEQLRDNRWVVRPEGQLGTCGWYPYAWTIEYVNANSASEALRKARHARADFDKWTSSLKNKGAVANDNGRHTVNMELNHVCCVCQVSLNNLPFNPNLQTSHGYCKACFEIALATVRNK